MAEVNTSNTSALATVGVGPSRAPGESDVIGVAARMGASGRFEVTTAPDGSSARADLTASIPGKPPATFTFSLTNKPDAELMVESGGKQVPFADWAQTNGLPGMTLKALGDTTRASLQAALAGAAGAKYQDHMEQRLNAMLQQGAPLGRTPALPSIGGPVGAAVGGAIKPLPSDVAAAIHGAQSASLYDEKGPEVVGGSVRFPNGLTATPMNGDVMLAGGGINSPVKLVELAKTNPDAHAFLKEVGVIAGIDFIKQEQTRIEGKLVELDAAGGGIYPLLFGAAGARGGVAKAFGLERDTAVGGAVDTETKRPK